ncbi:MAG: hypothetical protein GYB31_12945 [Bacteroidetes bacterium]|nr:hypothetical protein [Bacteroidota bacterium]
MLKIFRKVRQKFIAERKFSNYLLYALGEIILVVAGILIALAINNANENRVLRQKEQVYLAGLQNEFETSRQKLAELIRVNRESYEAASSIVESIDSKTTPDEADFSSLLYKTLAYDISFNPNNSLLLEMISSGSLKDINNTRLRAGLTNWVSTINDIAKQEGELGQQREKLIEIISSENYSIRTIFDQSGLSENQMYLARKEDPVSNLELLDNQAFENEILLFILTSISTEKAHYNPLMKDMDQILQMISSEITPP